MVTIPAKEPTTIIRGDTVKWTRALAEFLPADGWALTYYFTSASARVVVTTTNNGDGSFLAVISSAVSATLTVGQWYWQAAVAKAGEQYTVDSGAVDVAAGMAIATGGIDTRTWARRTLDAVEATLEGRATSDHTSMSINGRSISRMTPLELMDWRDRLRAEVRTEEQAEKAGLGRNIKVRFGRG